MVVIFEKAQVLPTKQRLPTKVYTVILHTVGNVQLEDIETTFAIISPAYQSLIPLETQTSFQTPGCIKNDQPKNINWLVVSTPLKNMSKSVEIIPNMMGKSFKIPWFQSPPTS